MEKKMQDFDVDQINNLLINSDELELPLTTQGILEGLMAIQYNQDFPNSLSRFNIYAFIQTIEWRWLNHRGTLPKRISKWYYDTYHKKMSEKLASTIGNIVRKNTIPNKEYHFDFTKSFTWKDGDFGDAGSCFWGDRAEIKTRMMQD